MKLLFLTLLLLIMTSCTDDDSSGASWPDSYDNIFTYTIVDQVDDLVLASSEAPANIIPFPPMDVRKVSLGLNGGYLYMRVDYADTIPSAQVEIPASATVEHQWVRNQSVSIVIDSDNSDATGASGDSVKGVDIFFALNFAYGSYTLHYANFDFPTTDIHKYNGSTKGEFGEGGVGTDYAVIRFNQSDISSFIAPGKSVEIGGWAESESVDESGERKYHHFAFDSFSPGVWNIE